MAQTTPLPDEPTLKMRAEPALDPLIGKRLNNIELVRRLDEGGMGAIYLGVNHELEKEYAVKVATREDDPTFEGRALREAKALSQLDHPNIVQIFDAHTLDDGRLAIVMPLLSGNSLQWHLRREADGRSRTYPVADAVHLALQLAMGLSEAHRGGFVHRDLKPGNVFVTQRQVELEGVRAPEVKLLDFGLVRSAQGGWQPLAPDGEVQEGAPARTIAGGTPEYVSPEQCTGTPHIDGRADLYGLGVLLFELLAGRLPFVPPAGMSAREQIGWLMRQHFRTPAPRVTAFAPKVPRALDDLVARLLEKAPEARPQTAKEVEDALRQILRSLPRESGSPTPRASLAVGLGVVAVAGLAVTWVGLLQRRPPPELPPEPPKSMPTGVSQAPAVPPLGARLPTDPPPPAVEPQALAPAVETTPPAGPALAEPPATAPKPAVTRVNKKPPSRKTQSQEAKVDPGCADLAMWRRDILADVSDLGRRLADKPPHYAKFKQLEARLSPLVRDARTPEECARANRVFKELLRATATP